MKLRVFAIMWVVLGRVLPALAQSDETMKAHGGITSAKAFDVAPLAPWRELVRWSAGAERLKELSG